MANVVRRCRAHGDWIFDMPKRWLFDYTDACVKPRHVIACEVRDFILSTGPEVPHVELWADWGAYDHVALCQLWGRMIDLPEGVPMWTNDLRRGRRSGTGEAGAVDAWNPAVTTPSMTRAR